MDTDRFVTVIVSKGKTKNIEIVNNGNVERASQRVNSPFSFPSLFACVSIHLPFCNLLKQRPSSWEGKG